MEGSHVPARYVAAGQRDGTGRATDRPFAYYRAPLAGWLAFYTAPAEEEGRRKQRVTSRMERGRQWRREEGRRWRKDRGQQQGPGGSRATGSISMGAPTARAGQAAGAGLQKRDRVALQPTGVAHLHIDVTRRAAEPSRYTHTDGKACAHAEPAPSERRLAIRTPARPLPVSSGLRAAAGGTAGACTPRPGRGGAGGASASRATRCRAGG
jgi:hypothetical protein